MFEVSSIREVMYEQKPQDDWYRTESSQSSLSSSEFWDSDSNSIFDTFKSPSSSLSTDEPWWARRTVQTETSSETKRFNEDIHRFNPNIATSVKSETGSLPDIRLSDVDRLQKHTAMRLTDATKSTQEQNKKDIEQIKQLVN